MSDQKLRKRKSVKQSFQDLGKKVRTVFKKPSNQSLSNNSVASSLTYPSSIDEPTPPTLTPTQTTTTTTTKITWDTTALHTHKHAAHKRHGHSHTHSASSFARRHSSYSHRISLIKQIQPALDQFRFDGSVAELQETLVVLAEGIGWTIVLLLHHHHQDGGSDSEEVRFSGSDFTRVCVLPEEFGTRLLHSLVSNTSRDASQGLKRTFDNGQGILERSYLLENSRGRRYQVFRGKFKYSLDRLPGGGGGTDGLQYDFVRLKVVPPERAELVLKEEEEGEGEEEWGGGGDFEQDDGFEIISDIEYVDPELIGLAL